MDPEFNMDYGFEDVEFLTNLIAENIEVISSAEKPKVEALPAEVLDSIDLDAVASGVAGIYDPLGQLRDWLVSQFAWVADTVRSFFEPILDAIGGTVDTIYSNVISIGKALTSLSDTIQSVIISPITDALNWISETFPSIVAQASSFIQQVMDALANLPNTLTSIISSVGSELSKAFSPITTLIENAISTLSNWISQIPTAIQETINFILTQLSNFGATISDLFAQVETWVSKLPAMFQEAISIVSTLVGDLGSTIREAISTLGGWVAQIPSAIQGVISQVTSWVSNLGTLIQEAITTVSNLISQIPSTINNLIASVSGTISNLGTMVQEAITTVSSWVSQIPSTIQGVIAQLSGWLSDLGRLVQDAIAVISNFIGSLPQKISGFITEISNRITGAFQELTQSASKIGETLSQLPKHVEDLLGKLSEGIKDIADSISQFFVGIGLAIPEFLKEVSPELYNEWVSLAQEIESPIDYLMKFPQVLWLGLKTAGALVWYFMPDEVKGFFDELTKRMTDVGTAFQGFVNAILKFPEWFDEYVKKPLEGLGSALGDALKGLPEALKGVADAISELVTDPAGFLRTKVAEPVIGAFKWFGEKALSILRDIGSLILNKIQEFGKWAMDTLGKVAVGIGKTISDATNAIIKTLTDYARSAVGSFSWLISETLNNMVKSLKDNFKNISQEYVKKFGQAGYLEVVYPTAFEELVKGISWSSLILSGIVSAQLALRFIVYIARAVASTLPRLLPRVWINLTPLGIGVITDFDIGKALRAVVWDLSKILEDWANELLRGLIYGGAIWTTRPLSRFFTATFRNILPIELPTLDIMVEAVRRRIPTVALKKVLDMMAYYMALYGYSDTVLNWYFNIPKEALPPEAEEKELYVEIYDRFNKRRTVPTSLVFELPSASELVRMMIRDVIIDPRYFIKIIAMKGYTKDTSLLYYLLHFRYPSPERLWEFYTRSVAGMLWYVPPAPSPDSPIWKDVYQLVDIYGIGKEHIPKAPRELNVTKKELHDKHLEALTRYYKWHDYAPFSWIPNYTSDRFIMFDLMADIPTKIDMRWMVRWGLIQQLGKYVTDLNTFTFDQIVDFMKIATGQELFSAKPTGKIEFDVRLFAKLLQATGLHPYWVPITSVAEAINALTDERTLLRTGILNMYKEGLIDINASESMMSGLFITDFKTARFNIKTGRWEEFTWKVPVVWLPAERTLMEMRSVFDRTLDIYREFYRSVMSGIRVLVVKPDEGKNIIKDFASKLLKFASDELGTVTGIQPKLAIDEKYLDLWIRYASIVRDIESKERIRMWMYRLVAWLFYRVSYGWVTEDDIDKVINVLKEKAFLSNYEADAIKSIMIEVTGVVGRQYIPTPPQLSTIVEYVPDAEQYFEKVMEQQRVPKEWWDVWRAYIMAKSLKTDAKSLLSVYIRAFRYGAVSKEELNKFIEDIKQYGFSNKEIEFYMKRIELEEAIEGVKEVRRAYMPTPTMLATLSEYMTLPSDLIKKVLEERKVPQEWIDIWLTYISVRPIKSDVKSLLSVYIRALRYGAVTKEEFEAFKKELPNYGFTNKEIEIISKRAELELAIESSREYLPTPTTLATLSEYMTLPRELVEKILKARKVPEEWMNIWLRYISVRPIKSDARSLLSVYVRAFRYGVISKEDLENFIKELPEYGFTDKEIEFIKRRAELEVLIEEYRTIGREYLPTPTMLATLSEYLVLPADLIIKTLKERGVPEEWINIWVRYIEVRPIKSDAKSLLSVYIRALRYGAVTKEEFEAFKKELPNYGFTPKEIELIVRRAELELAIENAREYVPTPTMLASMAEYVPEVRTFMTQVFDARRVPVEWRSIWAKYIALRPVIDDVRRYVTAVNRLYEYFIVDEDTLKGIYSSLRQFGYEDYELDVMLKTEGLYRIYRAYVSVIGTPRNLAIMSRYTPEARNLAYSTAVKMIDKLPVDNNTKNLLKAMWEHYVRASSVYEDLRAYVNELVRAYQYYAIDEATLDRELQQLKAYGLSDERIQLIKRRAQLARAREEAYLALRYGLY